MWVLIQKNLENSDELTKNINSMNVHYSRLLRQLQIYNRYIKIFQGDILRELDVKDSFHWFWNIFSKPVLNDIYFM